MAEIDAKTTAPNEETQGAAVEQQDAGPSNKQIRESKLFIAQAKKTKELGDQVAELRAAQQQAQQQAEINVAAEQGRLKEELERAIAERDSIKSSLLESHEAELRQRDVAIAAALAGARDQGAIDYLMFQHGRLEEKPENVAEWLSKLAESEENGHLFRRAQDPPPPPIGSPNGGQAAARAGSDKGDLLERLKRFDGDAIAEARALVLAGKKIH